QRALNDCLHVERVAKVQDAHQHDHQHRRDQPEFGDRHARFLAEQGKGREPTPHQLVSLSCEISLAIALNWSINVWLLFASKTRPWLVHARNRSIEVTVVPKEMTHRVMRRGFISSHKP